MRTLYVAAAILAAAFVATPAFAQDADPATVANFNGGHVEVIARRRHRSSGGGDSETGIAFGIAGGYDFRTGGAVVRHRAAKRPICTISEHAGVSAGRDLYAGARVGGVVSAARPALRQGRLHQCPRLRSAALGVNFDGIRAGAGVECMIGSEPLDPRRVSLLELRRRPVAPPGRGRPRLPLLSGRRGFD